MDAICGRPGDYSLEDSTCLCRPSYRFEGISLEHGTLGIVQLAKAAYLIVWLRMHRRGAVHDSSEHSSLMVLPVYARFLKFEVWNCVVWGIFMVCQAWYDQKMPREITRLETAVLQLCRYVSTFTWAFYTEGVFLFMCSDSAGAESLRTSVRVGALWASLLAAGCALLWLRWAGCSTPPEHWLLQLFWVGAWVPYWMRLVLMLPLYSTAALVLAVRQRQLAWERGALPLALFHASSALFFVLPKMALGVFTSSWLVSDAIALPLAWIAYTPFLTWVLARDSRYWSRCGFTACLMGDATAGRVATAPHRVPLLAARSSGSGFAPRFIIVDPSKLRFGVRIGQGSSSIVSAATLYGELVAVKQMEVSRLTREFASMFLTEAECLSHCRHPHIVRFVGGCVAPPLVCLVMEQCESSVHRLVHPRRSAAARHMRLAPLPDKVVCELLRGVVSGMAFLHDVMGITHGDLKPLNMLLRGNCVKLCDFGSSRLLQHDLSELAFSATLPYMAPELLVPASSTASNTASSTASSTAPIPSAATASAAHGSADGEGRSLAGAAATAAPNAERLKAGLKAGSGVGYAIDVYSFGVCVWEICVREYPWHALLEAGKVDELKRRVGTLADRPEEEHDDPIPITPPLRALIEACWRQEPSERPAFRQLDTLDFEVISRGGPAALRLIAQAVGQPSSSLLPPSFTDVESIYQGPLPPLPPLPSLPPPPPLPPLNALTAVAENAGRSPVCQSAYLRADSPGRIPRISSPDESFMVGR